MVDQVGQTTRRLSLDGDDWELLYVPETFTPARTWGEAIEKSYDRITASVPGTIEEALFKVGKLPDLTVGTNVEAAWELEYGDWWYRKEFDIGENDLSQDVSLLFSGVDTIAEVFINGTLVGAPQNMMIEHEFSVTNQLKIGSNEVVVHIFSPLLWVENKEYAAEYSQVEGSMESIWIRKPAHMYGWDIAPRVVSAGMHRSVSLAWRPKIRIREWWLETVSIGSGGSPAALLLHYVLSEAPRGRNFQLNCKLVSPDGKTDYEFSQTPTFLSGVLPVNIAEPELWQPVGMGDALLYEVTFGIEVEGVQTDVHSGRHGIRSIELKYQQGSDKNSQFEFWINEHPIVVMGTNWVPLDFLHSRDKDRLTRAFQLAKDSGVNMLRCWGGGLYEDTEFFELCDQAGILVWQDFSLACARYPQSHDFLETIQDEAESIVKKIRGHASLAIWCGSNENDDLYFATKLNPDSDRITREILPRVLHLHDPHRAYIAGSPTYSAEMVANRDANAPEQHLWGPRAYFKSEFYSQSRAKFVSEIGFHGLPSTRSLQKFIPSLTGSIEVGHPDWSYHDTNHRRTLPAREYDRNQLMVNQAQLMFGELENKLDALVPASQITQAEAKKFFIENCRLNGRSSRRAVQDTQVSRTGVIWWNLIDCWPQISDSVVDYYFEKKLSYFFIQASQQATCLMVAEAEGWGHDVFVVNDSTWHGEISYKIWRPGGLEPPITGTTSIHAEQRLLKIETLPLANSNDTFYLLEWTTEQGTGINHYAASSPPWSLLDYTNGILRPLAQHDPKFALDEIW